MAQTKYIGIGTLIISISLLISWFASRPDFRVEFSPNITCSGDCLNPSDSNCMEYFNITSLSKKFYIRNKGDMNLPFTEPEKVKSFQVYRADLRFKTDNPNRWKTINLSKGFTLQVNQTNEFKINLCKNNPNDDIKWGLQGFGINEDPVFFGTDIEILKDCHIKTSINSIPIYKDEIKYFYQNKCADEPINSSCSIVPYFNYTAKTQTGSYEHFDNKTICKDIGFNISGKVIDYEKVNWKCSRDNFIITCDAPHQSNKDGICQSGERCIEIDIRNLSDIKQIRYSPTNAIKDIEIE